MSSTFAQRCTHTNTYIRNKIIYTRTYTQTHKHRHTHAHITPYTYALSHTRLKHINTIHVAGFLKGKLFTKVLIDI